MYDSSVYNLQDKLCGRDNWNTPQHHRWYKGRIPCWLGHRYHRDMHALAYITLHMHARAPCKRGHQLACMNPLRLRCTRTYARQTRMNIHCHQSLFCFWNFVPFHLKIQRKVNCNSLAELRVTLEAPVSLPPLPVSLPHYLWHLPTTCAYQLVLP